MRRWLRPLLITAVLAAAAAPKIAPELSSDMTWPPSFSFLDSAAGKTSPASAGSTGPDQGAGAPRAGRSSAPIRVSAVLVTPAPLAEIVASTGTLLADEGVELQAEVNGRIVAIHFSEGARVRKGELLVKLGDAELQAMRGAAVLELELAEKRQRRASELLAQGFVREDEHDIALNTVQLSRAEIVLTEAQIAKTEIRAPFDGIAGLRYVSEGAFVNASTRIATLQHIDTLKVEFSVPEKYAGRIGLGSPISFTVAGQAQEFSGHVYAQDPRIDAATRTLLIRALCPNPGGRLLPGTFANVKLTVTETRDALLIPAAALIPDLDAAYVFVLNDGKAERRPVVTGLRTDSRVQIVAGLDPGDVVITSALQQIRPQTPVEADISGERPLSEATGSNGSRTSLVDPPSLLLDRADGAPLQTGTAFRW